MSFPLCENLDGIFIVWLGDYCIGRVVRIKLDSCMSKSIFLESIKMGVPLLVVSITMVGSDSCAMSLK